MTGQREAFQARSILVATIIASGGFALLAIGFLRYQHTRWATAFLILAFFGAGTVLSIIENRPIASHRIARLYDEGAVGPGDPVEVTGTVAGEPEPAPQSFYLTVQTETIQLKQADKAVAGTILLYARTPDEGVLAQYEALELHHGARVRVMTRLDRDADFRNPGVSPFTEYLERKGYDATGVIKSPLLIERLGDQRVFLPLAWLYQWRAHLQREFSQRFSGETASVLNAALLGNAHNISYRTAERFRAGGTFHILVISGMQIAFIAGVVLLIVRRITQSTILQFLLAAAFLWSYTIAVGAEASVTRAALMFTIAAFAPVVARKPGSLNTIAGAGLVLLIWKPSDLFDPSFQLTFLSVIAIVCLAVPVLRNMQRVGSWRPTMVTPYPPQCPRWFRTLSETLFWREREWQDEISGSNIRYRLFKTRLAVVAERWHTQWLFRFVAAALVVSGSVQIVLLPVTIIYFHRLSISSLVLNIFVGALMVAMAFAALAAVLLSQISATIALPLVMLAEKLNWLLVHVVDPFSYFNVASMRLPHYTGWGALVYGLYFLALSILLLRLTRWDPLHQAPRQSHLSWQARIGVTACFVLTALIIFHPFSAAKPDGRLHIDFLDVGQGDAAFLTLPDGTTILIDGGGQPNFDWNSRDVDEDEPFERDTRSIGERVVSEYLWSRGLDRVDYLIATHADADHIEGLNDVARNFKVRAALVARTPANDPEFARFAETMRRARLPVETIGAGDLMRIDNVSFEVLWPPATSNVNASSRNNDSILLRVRMGERSFLFTGDIEKGGEGLVLTEGIDLSSDVVKVAHHGSRTSSIAAFVGATHPSLAVISVGRASMFGHPHEEVVERWRASGAQVMTTGEKGTISLVTDGRELRIETFVRE
ncbi:MAG TPA: ComEC/Rec2 family competence protein [Pyrinomonadaceae bacterium]|nr:ComEC/Rec2 family competence protein [Pyrinomonadaceae bacterium]